MATTSIRPSSSSATLAIRATVPDVDPLVAPSHLGAPGDEDHAELAVASRQSAIRAR